MMGDDDTTIGRGGWILVAASGLVTLGVLRGLMHYHVVPSALFSAAIALIVLLILHRLAEAVNRYDDEEEARKVRKLVPVSTEMGLRPGEGVAAVAVPVRADAVVSPQRPSSVVRPLAEVASAPVILADPVGDLGQEPVQEVAVPVAAGVKGKPAAKPKAKATKTAKKADAGTAAKAPKASKAKAATVAAAGGTGGQGPVRLTAPRGGAADDLQEIEGIGPALEKLLNGLGFYHFDQIAAWSDADVALIDGEMKTFKGRIQRDKWVEQARIIVTDGLEAFRERARTNDY